MKSIFENYTILTLNEEEVNWLLSAIQNPMNGVSLENEDLYNKKMRNKLYDALNNEMS